MKKRIMSLFLAAAMVLALTPLSALAAGGNSKIELYGPYFYDSDQNIMMTEAELTQFEKENPGYGDSVYYLIVEQNEDIWSSIVSQTKEYKEDLTVKAEWREGKEAVASVSIVPIQVAPFVQKSDGSGWFGGSMPGEFLPFDRLPEYDSLDEDLQFYIYFVEIKTNELDRIEDTMVDGRLTFDRKASTVNGVKIPKIDDDSSDITFTLGTKKSWRTDDTLLVEGSAEIGIDDTVALKFEGGEVDLQFGEEAEFSVNSNGQGKVIMQVTTTPSDAVMAANPGATVYALNFINKAPGGTVSIPGGGQEETPPEQPGEGGDDDPPATGGTIDGVRFNRSGTLTINKPEGARHLYIIQGGALIEQPNAVDPQSEEITIITNNLVQYIISDLPLTQPDPAAANFEYSIQNGEATITGYNGKDETVVIPSELEGAPVTAIGERAFAENYYIRQLSMPSVKRIGSTAFYYCTGLKAVSMPKVEEIGRSAFSNCHSLAEADMPSVKKIESYAFKDCYALGEVTLPVGALTEPNAFGSKTKVNRPTPTDADFILATNADGSLTVTGYKGSGGAVTIPDSIGGAPVTAIADRAFYYRNGITSINTGAVSVIGADAFANCYNLISAELPNVTEIGERAFINSGLASVNAPNAVKIGDRVFFSCYNLKNITAPAAETIGARAFADCDALAAVSLPNVKEVGSYAFQSCDALVSISLPMAEVIGGWAFTDCYRLSRADIPSAKTIGERAFRYCQALASVSLPAATYIDIEAFAGCSSLAEVSLPNVKEIWDRSFNGCPKLKELTVPTGAIVSIYAFGNSPTRLIRKTSSSWADFSYTVIDSDGFIGAGSAVITGYNGIGGDVEIPNYIDWWPVVEIAVGAFRNNDSITSISAASDSYLNTVGQVAFANCNNLKSVSLPTVKSVGTEAFRGCGRLEAVELEGCTQIGNGAFRECSSLKNVSAPNAYTIGQYAFFGCKALGRISLPPDVKLGANALPSTTIVIRQDARFKDFSYIADQDGRIVITGYFGPGGEVHVPGWIDERLVVEIAAGAFSGNGSITSITTDSNSGLEKVGQEAFKGCSSLETVELESCTEIGSGAFRECPALKNVSIYNAETIGQYAFYGCKSLGRISLLADANIGANAFPPETTVTYHDRRHGYFTYRTDDRGAIITGYFGPGGDVEVPGSVNSTSSHISCYMIDVGAFAGNSLITSVTSDKILHIQASAFSGCTNLVSADFPMVRGIRASTFSGCTKLKSITVKKGAQIEPNALPPGVEMKYVS